MRASKLGLQKGIGRLDGLRMLLLKQLDSGFSSTNGFVKAASRRDNLKCCRSTYRLVRFCDMKLLTQRNRPEGYGMLVD